MSPKWSNASVSILSESEGEQAIDIRILLGNKGCEPAIPSLLDRLHVQALLKSELTLQSAIGDHFD